MDRGLKNIRFKQFDCISLSLGGLVLGVLFSYNGLSRFYVILLSLIVSPVVFILNKRFCFFTFFLVTSALITAQQLKISDTNIVNANIKEITSISGKVLQCRETSFAVRYILLVDKYQLTDNRTFKSSGKVLLNTGKKYVFPAGSSIKALEVSLRELQPPKNPGEEDFRVFMHKQGIFLQGKTGKILLLEPPKNRVNNLLVRIRKKLSDRLDKSFIYFSEEKALLETMTLGNENVPFFLREAGKKSGTYHLLVISGLHLAFLILFLRIIFIPFRNFNNRHPKFFPSFAMFVLWFYVGITGFRVPVMRASLMLSFFFLSEIFEQEINVFQSVLLAAILLLIFNPLNLFNVSFQLSFVATMGILFFVKRYASFAQKGFIQGLLVSSLGAQVSVLPILIYHFGIFYPVGFINNIIFMPLAGSIMLAFPIFLIFPFLVIPLRLLLSVFLCLATFSSQVTKGFELHFSLPVLFGFYILLLIFFSRTSIKKRLVYSLFVLIVVITILLYTPKTEQTREDKLYFLSIDKPTIIFVNGQELTAFMYDDYRKRALENVILPFFKEKKISRVNQLFYTDISYHHIGTLKALEKKMKIENIYEYEPVKDTLFYPYLSIYFYNNNKYFFVLKKREDKVVLPELQVEFLDEEKSKLSYIVKKGDIKILISQYLSQEVAEKISDQKFNIAWVSDMKTTVKVKKLLEATQFEYLVLPKDLKKFSGLNSELKTFYLNDSAVIVDFETVPLSISYYQDSSLSLK